jgi:hypothetical protein
LKIALDYLEMLSKKPKRASPLDKSLIASLDADFAKAFSEALASKQRNK